MKNRYSATLLLAIPFVVAMVPAVAHSSRTIDVTMSRSAMVPEQIDMQVGERVRLHVISTDGAHVFQVKGLRVDARIPAGGEIVTVDLTPTDAGIFQIEGETKGRFVVTPEK
jgi:heme/copper-type cytochrome/quinol oxidase subunit 2